MLYTTGIVHIVLLYSEQATFTLCYEVLTIYNYDLLAYSEINILPFNTNRLQRTENELI